MGHVPSCREQLACTLQQGSNSSSPGAARTPTPQHLLEQSNSVEADPFWVWAPHVLELNVVQLRYRVATTSLEVGVVVELSVCSQAIEVRKVELPAPVVVRAILTHWLKGIWLHIINAADVACTLQHSIMVSPQ